MTGVQARSTSRGSLAHGVAADRAAAGTLVAQAIGGGITVRPREGRTILFGRHVEEVHVCIGPDDRGVSRRHGVLSCRADRWWVRNVGRRPARMAGRMLYPNEDPVPLASGYTPLFVQGHGAREHLLELYVTGPDGDRPHAQPDAETHQPRIWPLSEAEQVALVVLGQRYLLHEPSPQPLSWQQAADQLADLEPAGRWTAKRLEHLVGRVRARLAERGVFGLRREDIAGPVGNALNDNLLRELVGSTTLVPPDLERFLP